MTYTDIENDNYSTNDVADLRMRLDIATDALKLIANTTYGDGEKSKLGAITNIYGTVETTLTRLNKGHSCEVRLNRFGFYGCECGLK